MKIVALNGSHRGEKGYTQFLLNKLAAGAREGGAQFDTIVLAEKQINRCRGCFACQQEKSYLKCIFQDKDDVADIYEQMRQADLIIFATPVYIFTMSSLLKSLLERFMSTADCSKMRLAESGLFFHNIDPILGSKPFALLVCCDNLETETPLNIISYFRTYARFMDAPMVGTLVRGMGEAVGHGKVIKNTRQFPYIEMVYQAYWQAGFELAARGYISKQTEKKANHPFIKIPPIADWLFRHNFRPMKRKILQMANTNKVG